MAYDLSVINYRTIRDPVEFILESDETYEKNVEKAAEKIADNLKQSPIVLLAGPSGSGKTTTASKISEALEKHGIKSNYVSMDDYFLGVSEGVTPKTPEGEFDLESPLCLDIDMINDHFSRLSAGGEVAVPAYDFTAQKRSDRISKTVRLDKDEVAVFEGIHALNPMFTQKHPEAFKLYISARSDVVFRDTIVFKRTWFFQKDLVQAHEKACARLQLQGSEPRVHDEHVGKRQKRGDDLHLSVQKHRRLPVRHFASL